MKPIYPREAVTGILQLFYQTIYKFIAFSVPRMGFCKQRMWRCVVPATQSPVERLGARAEVHKLDHRMREKQRRHHAGGQLIRIVGFGDHKDYDKYVLRVYDYSDDPAVDLPEQHGQPGIIVVVFGYEQPGQLY